MHNELDIHPEHMLLGNNPEIAQIFAREDVQELIKRMLADIESPYTLKKFLKEGHEAYYEDIVSQLKDSFTVIERGKEKDEYATVERSFDQQKFSVGETVTIVDKFDGQTKEWNGPIGRLYEDDRGLHVRIDLDGTKSITWRKLSQLKR
jgi:hypothetical protein